MNKKRLLKLADLLEADAKKKRGVKFDMTAWAKKDDGEGYLRSWEFKRGETVEVNCSTAACAFGLAAISGAFKRQGLGYMIQAGGNLVPTYAKKIEFGAARAFFDIDNRESEFLFDPYEYPKSKREGAVSELFVAKRIRDFVAGKVVPPAHSAL